MTRKPKPKTIDTLRREIDKIDDKLHDLVMKRGEIMQSILVAKGTDAATATPATTLRPAREAAILRRLAARHAGTLPQTVIARIWRELIATALRLQTSFSVFVYNGDDVTDYWDLARNHFGSWAPMTGAKTAPQVVHGCARDPKAIGVLPMPGAEGPRSGPAWWTQLASTGEKGLRIIARLPFSSDGDANQKSTSALVLATAAPEDTGDDSTLLIVEAGADVSRTRLLGLFKESGFEVQIVDSENEAKKGTQALYLVQANGFCAPGDPRLTTLQQKAKAAIAWVFVAGAYANPLRGAAAPVAAAAPVPATAS